MKMKAIQVILEALKVVFISFIVALIILFVDEKNVFHVILSIPIVLVVFRYKQGYHRLRKGYDR